MKTDVLIIGGGPAGSTVASLLKTYAPSLDILIVEREVFPRDHIGESQLTAVCAIQNEMGVWDKVEAAGFPVKIGSTYRWGKTDELWQINFLRDEQFRDEPRPAKFAGQRAETAFQVDRSIYDEILLDHAQSLGCDVRQGVKAISFRKEGDRVLSATIGPAKGGGPTEEVEARYYVDASGGSGLLRREMDVEVESPTCLRNIAMWHYWRDTEWAETVGNGGTRAQILSIGWGWIWFIPIGKTRTSIGVVTPAAHLKSCGKPPEQLYMEGLASEPRVMKLIQNASKEEKFWTTKDWSYLAGRIYGENWFLSGDSCGFADPILSAGMTLAQVGARKLAYTILDMERGDHDPEWLKAEYNRSHRANIRQHIRFAEFWYAGNGRFTDLHNFCAEIAQDSGLKLTPENAFQWIGTGGFAEDTFSEVHAISTRFASSRAVIGQMLDIPDWEAAKHNVYRLNLEGAEKGKVAFYDKGRIKAVNAFRRGDKILPLVNENLLVYNALVEQSDAVTVAQGFRKFLASQPQRFPDPFQSYAGVIEALETMISQGWVQASVDPQRPFIPVV
jgi:flavin-dependent dehydrogenase